MVGRKHITPKRQQKPRLVITENFLKELETVIMYGYTVFGDNTAKKFLSGVLGRIFALPSMPHANPKSRFVESTERKVYRYIIYEKYYVVYSVTKTTIRVISIVHQAINPKSNKRIKMKKLILIRHGESEWNKLNLFTGWTNVDLSEKGVQEAIEAGKVLKENGYKPEICFTSYLKRAIKTLNLALEAMDMDWLPVYKSWRLNEKSYGQLQGLDKKMTAEKYGDEQVRLWRRAFDVRPPALDMNDPKSPRMDPRYAELTDEQIPLTEALCDTIERVMPYYENNIMKAFETHDQVLVVAHGNSLRGVVKVLKGMSNDEIIAFNIPTGIPYVFEFDDNMKLQKDFFLGDPEKVAALMAAVANQGKAK